MTYKAISKQSQGHLDSSCILICTIVKQNQDIKRDEDHNQVVEVVAR